MHGECWVFLLSCYTPSLLPPHRVRHSATLHHGTTLRHGATLCHGATLLHDAQLTAASRWLSTASLRFVSASTFYCSSFVVSDLLSSLCPCHNLTLHRSDHSSTIIERPFGGPSSSEQPPMKSDLAYRGKIWKMYQVGSSQNSFHDISRYNIIMHSTCTSPMFLFEQWKYLTKCYWYLV